MYLLVIQWPFHRELPSDVHMTSYLTQIWQNMALSDVISEPFQNMSCHGWDRFEVKIKCYPLFFCAIRLSRWIRTIVTGWFSIVFRFCQFQRPILDGAIIWLVSDWYLDWSHLYLGKIWRQINYLAEFTHSDMTSYFWHSCRFWKIASDWNLNQWTDISIRYSHILFVMWPDFLLIISDSVCKKSGHITKISVVSDSPRTKWAVLMNTRFQWGGTMAMALEMPSMPCNVLMCTPHGIYFSTPHSVCFCTRVLPQYLPRGRGYDIPQFDGSNRHHQKNHIHIHFHFFAGCAVAPRPIIWWVMTPPIDRLIGSGRWAMVWECGRCRRCFGPGQTVSDSMIAN